MEIDKNFLFIGTKVQTSQKHYIREFLCSYSDASFINVFACLVQEVHRGLHKGNYPRIRNWEIPENIGTGKFI